MGVKVTSKNLYNMKQRARNAQLGGLIAVRWLYDTLQELRSVDSNYGGYPACVLQKGLLVGHV